MFRHVVNFKLKEDKKHLAGEAKRRILELGALPQVRNIEVGINEIESARCYDFGIIVDFDSREDYDVYDKHEMHIPVKEYIFAMIESAASVDYNI